LSVGDIELAGYSISNLAIYLNHTDTELSEMDALLKTTRDTVIQLKQLPSLNVPEIESAVVSSLLGKNTDPAILDIDFDEHTKNMQEGMSLVARYVISIRQTYLAYLFDDYSRIIEYIEEAEKAWKNLNIPLIFFKVAIAFYAPLVYLQLFQRNTPGEEKKKYLVRAKEGLATMKEWAKFGPRNFLHKQYLIQAELYRVTGKKEHASRYYDKSIKTAFENGYINEAALANELAAKFYMQNKRDKFAALYLTEARSCYFKWGAVAKIKHLEKNYPKYLSMRTPGSQISSTGTVSSASNDSTNEFLDVKSIIKASQTLSREFQLDKFLENMMHILMENAGAQKSLFIENRNDELLIQAERSSDGVSSILKNLPLDDSGKAPLSVIHYVTHSKQKLVFDNLSKDTGYNSDGYIQSHHPKSAVCFPILSKGKISAIIYLENNLVEGAFTPARLEVLNTLSSQIAISMENARVYHELDELNKSLEQKVTDRTKEIAGKNRILEHQSQQLKELDEAKSRFFANISHEFRTPLTLIMGPLEQILDKNPEPALQNQAQLMLRNSQRLLNQVNQLLELARFESGKMRLDAREQD
ncbi:MAG: GAF domain-containing protein, partial [bacterium]|nr:GAF domain-containing protein [bacterium]